MILRAALLQALLQLSVYTSSAQIAETFMLDKYSNDISFIRMDSVHSSQATVVEYPSFLVVIELPFTDKSTDLREDVVTAERFILFLKKRFDNKPVKYVLSTHWHLHSLSAITPFFKNGTKLITAASNWHYSVAQGFLGTTNVETFANNIIEIKRDSSILKNTKFPIDIIFLDSTFTHKPTKDYLFFYFPAVRILHASCMCALSDVNFKVRKHFIYSDRITDLSKAITTRNLNVTNIIKLGRFDHSAGNYPPLSSPVPTYPSL